MQFAPSGGRGGGGRHRQTFAPSPTKGSKDSSAREPLSSWLKGHEIESLQEWRENFLLQGQLSVLTRYFIRFTHVTAAVCKRSWSFCQKCRWQVADKHTCTLAYLCGFEWSDTVNWCVVVWHAQNMRRDDSSFMCPQTCNNQTVLSEHHFGGFFFF